MKSGRNMPGEQTRLIYPKYNDSQYSHNIISQIWFLVNNPLETLKEYSDTETSKSQLCQKVFKYSSGSNLNRFSIFFKLVFSWRTTTNYQRIWKLSIPWSNNKWIQVLSERKKWQNIRVKLFKKGYFQTISKQQEIAK